MLQFLRERDAPQCVSTLHCLAQRGKLVARRHWLVAVPQLLADVGSISTSPLLNKTGYVRHLLVVPTCVSFADTLGMRAEHVFATILFQ
ncbi:MAG: hypothetical protein ACFHHU_01490 [Porticoccaceae bacterium]